jgi:protein-disulfide isomerase
MRRYLPFVIIAAVLIAGLAVAFALFRSKQTAGSASFVAIQPSPNRASASAATTQPKTPTSVVNVSVTVEEFGDYQCPPCGLLHPELKKIEHEYGSRVNFVFHNLPLSKIHKNALVAAQAAEAARLQNSFWQMHDLLYENQNAWKDQDDPRPKFISYARDLGLDSKRFTRDMDGPEVQQRIAADQQQAGSAGINGTPTILIEGRQLKPEVTNPEGIRKGIDLLLARKAAAQ